MCLCSRRKWLTTKEYVLSVARIPFYTKGWLWYSQLPKTTCRNGPSPFQEAVNIWYQIDLCLSKVKQPPRHKEEERTQFFLGSRENNACICWSLAANRLLVQDIRQLVTVQVIPAPITVWHTILVYVFIWCLHRSTICEVMYHLVSHQKLTKVKVRISMNYFLKRNAHNCFESHKGKLLLNRGFKTCMNPTSVSLHVS